MASERRAQVVRLAEILGVEFERSLGTAELMEMCVTEADLRLGSGDGDREPAESEGDEGEEQDEAPPDEMRRALRSLPAPAVEETERPKHRAGGSGARKQRQASACYDAENETIARLREVPGSGVLGEMAEVIAEVTEAVAPVLEATRSGRRGQRRAS